VGGEVKVVKLEGKRRRKEWKAMMELPEPARETLVWCELGGCASPLGTLRMQMKDKDGPCRKDYELPPCSGALSLRACRLAWAV
jgi:hypothetical protein